VIGLDPRYRLVSSYFLMMLCEPHHDDIRGALIFALVEILTVTGFAQKLSFAMLDIAQGSLLLLLVMAALACLAFGLGLSSSASYILVALLGAPALVSLDVPLLAAHFFVFFFANISAITPPVAVACLVAAKIADARFFRTCFIAVRLGLPGFILPFLFVAHPEILGLDAGFGYTALVSAMALLGVVALNVIAGGLSPPSAELGGAPPPPARRAGAAASEPVGISGRHRDLRRPSRVAVVRPREPSAGP
jgi:hypothetical protein